MIPPKLPASQELALHRVNVQQQSFSPLFSGVGESASASASSSSAVIGGSGFQRASSARVELTSPLFSSGVAGGSMGFPPIATPNSPLSANRPVGPSPIASLSGGGANSTAPASIARPGVRARPEWSSALDNACAFAVPTQQLRGSTPATWRSVDVCYIADRYDRQWLAQRLATAAPKGKAGGSSGNSNNSSGGERPSGPDIPLALFECLVTAFELAAHASPDIPLQRLPLAGLDAVAATGADAAVVAAVREYWLGRRQALGGNVPCIPALHMNVREDGQTALCHADLLQYCPLPFNHRDWAMNAVQRYAPGEGMKEEGEESMGRKRRREESGEAAKEAERKALIASALAVAEAVLERETWKMRHTNLVLYELALLRRCAIAERDGGEGSSEGIWATDEALDDEWTLRDCDDDDTVEGMQSGTAAAECVVGIEERV